MDASRQPPGYPAYQDLLDACRQIVSALDTKDEEELANGYASARLAVKKAQEDG